MQIIGRGKAFKGSIRGHYRFSATLDLCNISAFCVKPPECGGGRRQVDYTRARVSRIKFHGDIYSPASDAFFFRGTKAKAQKRKETRLARHGEQAEDEHKGGFAPLRTEERKKWKIDSHLRGSRANSDLIFHSLPAPAISGRKSS
jgi:hypothetical protein